MQNKKYTYYLKSFLVTVITIFILTSCNRYSFTASSGKAKTPNRRDHSGIFKMRAKGANKPPQMGFYARKTGQGFVHLTVFRIKYWAAPKDKKHNVGNELRSTSPDYNDRMSQASQKRLNNSFIKKQGVAKSGGNTGWDNTEDSFSKNHNKREKPKSGIYKRHR